MWLPNLQMAIPEVMVLTDMEKKHSTIAFDIKPQAVGIGPGIGQEEATQKSTARILITNSIPLVIDADALNILSKNRSWLSLLPSKSILTPHPKELERLIGKWDSEEENSKTIVFTAL
jgi:NAD(P)H-hydrate repair Nnr-like enzyme with NAD(P)H-hydrate dehydratase domain